MATAESFREQASRLFTLAIEARDKGNTQLANMLTDAAARFLEQAVSVDAAESIKSPIHDAPPVLQQQQMQPQK
jgi:hypothetical protein